MNQFNKEKMSDVVFLLEDEKERVYAHKAILVARSQYFRTMFM